MSKVQLDVATIALYKIKSKLLFETMKYNATAALPGNSDVLANAKCSRYFENAMFENLVLKWLPC